MRNPEKLRIGPAAIEFAVLVYQYTVDFPPEERFGLAFHMRKTAIAIGSNVNTRPPAVAVHELLRSNR